MTDSHSTDGRLVRTEAALTCILTIGSVRFQCLPGLSATAAVCAVLTAILRYPVTLTAYSPSYVSCPQTMRRVEFLHGLRRQAGQRGGGGVSLCITCCITPPLLTHMNTSSTAITNPRPYKRFGRTRREVLPHYRNPSPGGPLFGNVRLRA